MLADDMRYRDAAFAFLVAMAVATVLTPISGRIARRLNPVARPSIERVR